LKKYSATVVLDAPVVAVASVDIQRGVVVIAAGLMNGRVVLVTVSTRPNLTLSVQEDSTLSPPRHSKYVTALAWGSSSSLDDATVWLASSSADGTIHVSTVVQQSTENDDDDDTPTTRVTATHCKSLHFDEAVPCLCWCRGTIYAYVRGTPHLTCIQIPTEKSSLQDYVVTKLHLNAHPLDDHVSFAVLQLQPSPDGRFLAAATDANRHVILDVSLQPPRIVQNLYDHDADAYSSPKVAWSTNGLYLYSNTQHDARLLVYEIASGRVVATLNAMATTPSSAPNATATTASTAAVVASLPVHVRPIKDLYSATTQTNMVVTISFDRNLVAWFPPPHLTE
jgi:WD40 repeat protein